MSENEVLQVKEGNDKTSEVEESKSELQQESQELRESNPVNDDTTDTASDLVPELELVEDKPLTGEELKRAKFVQDQVISLFKVTQPRPEGLTDQEYDEHVDKKIEAIRKEKEAGIYGPESKEAFKNTVTWLEQQAIPGAVTELHRLELEIPAGSPLTLPKDKQDRAISVDLYKELVAEGYLKARLNIDANELPEDQELDKFSDSLLWLKEVDERATTARAQQQDRLLEKEIKRLISDPETQEAWLDRRDSTPEEWRRAAIRAVDLANRVRNYTEAMDSLNRASNARSFSFEKPPGAEVIRNDKGKITEVKLDLPKDLRLDHPENAKKVRELEQWMKDHGEEVDQAIQELIKLESDPDRLLYWGEVDMPTTAVKLDAQGNVSDFIEPKNERGHEPKINLVDLEFDVKEVKGEDGTTKIVVSNDVQYRNSKWYNYLNIGAESIGNEINVPSREYDPEDWVPIRSGGKVEIMKAKDLASWKLRRQTFHYGEKALIATLDASMLVTGTIAVGGAVKAARAGQLVLSQAAKQAAKGALRATVGATGIVNNAYFQNTDIGQKIQTARGLYFVGEAAIGLGAGGWRLAKSFRGAAETANAGKSAAAIVEQHIEATKWANRIYKPAEVAATATMYPFAAIIGMDIHHQLDGLSEIGRNDPTRAALRQAKDGRGDHEPEKQAEVGPITDELKSAELEKYGELLATDSTNPKIKEIIEKTQKLIEEDANAQEIKEYKQELMEHFMPSSDYIVDAEKDHSFSSQKANGHVVYQEKQSRDVQTAAALALLQLSRNEDGSIDETLAERNVDIPEYQYKVQEFDEYSGTSYDVTKTKPARVESQALKTSDIANFLRREIESPKEESRLVASSDLALQLGVASGREVAGILQDVITSDSSTELEKTEAVLRLGLTVDALKVQESADLTVEEQAREDSKKVGLSSRAIKAYLEDLSSTGATENVRAAATLMSFANNESDANERRALISKYAKLLSESAQAPQEFTTKAIEALEGELGSENSSGERKFHAAAALIEFTKGGGEFVNENPGLKQRTYEAVSQLVSKEDVALSTDAIKLLTPEGLRSLSPRSAESVRRNTVGIVTNLGDEIYNNTLTSKDIENRVKFLEVIKPVVVDASQLQKNSVEVTLISVFDSKAGYNYADFSPELRKAAIKAVTDLGSRTAFGKLRETLAGNSEEGIKKDWDASVRYEALKALEQMKDPKLRGVVLSIIGSETDPLVSARLSDVRFTQQRLDPTSEEYKREYEAAKARLIRDPFSGHKSIERDIQRTFGNTPNARKKYIRKFMDDNYPLLNGKTYSDKRSDEGHDAADEVYSGLGGNISWLFSSRSTIDRNESNAKINRQNEIFAQRARQFERLIDDAALTNDKGMKAKMALADILHSNGNHFQSNEAVWAQQQAAKALLELSKPGVENREFVTWAIKTGLTSSPSMDAWSRRRLYEALVVNLANPSQTGGRVMSKEEVSITAAEALKLQQNQRLEEPDSGLQRALIRTIVANGHHRIYPVFEAMAESSKDQRVKADAKNALELMRDSVLRSFNELPVDHTTTRAQAALNIEEAMQNNDNNSQEVIDAIFAATKLQRIGGVRTSEKFFVEDPRVKVLEVAMNSNNEKVRLAAAGGLLHMVHFSRLNDGNISLDLTKARNILESIQTNSTVDRLKHDARMFSTLARAR